MNAARKQLPPPDGDDQLAESLRRRLQRADEAAEITTPVPALASGASGSTARTTRKRATPAMDRRSWYMPKDSADALSTAVENLYFATRRPKHEILAALIDAALAEYPAVQSRLTSGGTSH